MRPEGGRQQASSDVRTHAELCEFIAQKAPDVQRATLPFEGRNEVLWRDAHTTALDCASCDCCDCCEVCTCEEDSPTAKAHCCPTKAHAAHDAALAKSFSRAHLALDEDAGPIESCAESDVAAQLAAQLANRPLLLRDATADWRARSPPSSQKSR